FTAHSSSLHYPAPTHIYTLSLHDALPIFNLPETRTLIPLHPNRKAESTDFRIARRKPTRFSNWRAINSDTNWASNSGLCTSWMSSEERRVRIERIYWRVWIDFEES